MNRRLVLAAGAIALAGAATLPATAAAPKPKAFSGSYTVTLEPDPTQNVTHNSPTTFGYGCSGLRGDESIHRKTLTIPGKGTLKVVLTSPDPTGAPEGIGLDWDMYIEAPGDEELDSSTSAAAYEETNTKFTKAQKVVIEVCNLTGQTDGKITFAYKPS